MRWQPKPRERSASRCAQSTLPRDLVVVLDLYPRQATMRRCNNRIYQLVTVINPEQSAQDATVRFAVQAVREHLEREVIGQSHLVQRMLMALLCGGHVLVEGAPGLAKTRAIKALANVIEETFTGFNLPRTYCPAMSPEPRFTVRRTAALIFSPARSSTT